MVLTEEDRQKHIDEYSLSEDFVITMPNPCISNIEYEYHYDKEISCSRAISGREKFC